MRPFPYSRALPFSAPAGRALGASPWGLGALGGDPTPDREGYSVVVPIQGQQAVNGY